MGDICNTINLYENTLVYTLYQRVFNFSWVLISKKNHSAPFLNYKSPLPNNNCEQSWQILSVFIGFLAPVSNPAFLLQNE